MHDFLSSGKHFDNILCFISSEDSNRALPNHGGHDQAAGQRLPDLLEGHLRHRLSSGAASGVRPQQHRGNAMSLCGAGHGGLLGDRGVALARHGPYSYGTVSSHGRAGFGSHLPVLSEGDEYDVRRRAGDRHRCRAL